ncbi:hypothetical protein SAMN05880556_10148 [Azospirillum sp. RU38E]|nr:hypothetical protein SAMN05880556_10148 [Azospirillum sp. RU38E]SNR99648.1 hypothetical protein SAMN05880591_10148 [Azospirillum sp. RU37A]
MAISGISAYASQAVSQSPTVRSTDGGSRVQAVGAVQQDNSSNPAEESRESVQNTAPTENERQEALQSGRTRGSFVNITA